MDQEQAIKQHIESQRERLGENLDVLESRVRTATNWRTWVRKKPLVALGLAAGAGFWLGFRK